MLLLPQEQTSEAWETFKKKQCSSRNRGAVDGKVLSFFLGI
jgi:hypothetical protein